MSVYRFSVNEQEDEKKRKNEKNNYLFQERQ